MQKFPVISGTLNRVANCVTEIQKRALPVRSRSSFATILDLIWILRLISRCRAGAAPAFHDCSIRNIFASAIMACLMISANP